MSSSLNSVARRAGRPGLTRLVKAYCVGGIDTSYAESQAESNSLICIQQRNKIGSNSEVPTPAISPNSSGSPTQSDSEETRSAEATRSQNPPRANTEDHPIAPLSGSSTREDTFFGTRRKSQRNRKSPLEEIELGFNTNDGRGAEQVGFHGQRRQRLPRCRIFIGSLSPARAEPLSRWFDRGGDEVGGAGSVKESDRGSYHDSCDMGQPSETKRARWWNGRKLSRRR
ncbi:hypothetical protein Bca4012_018226 [Brassica carinata]